LIVFNAKYAKFAKGEEPCKPEVASGATSPRL